MDLFEQMRSHLTIIGIRSNQSDQRYLTNGLNMKNLTLLLVLALNTATNVIYLFYGANGFQEYVFTVFSVSTLSVLGVTFRIFIGKTTEIFIFFDQVEKAIENRKSEL